MEYRYRKLNDKFKEMEWLLSGTGESYRTLIQNPDGRFSKTKIDRMIDEFMECLSEYRTRYDFERLENPDRDHPPVFSKKEEGFYRSFFYLVIGLALHNNSNGPIEKMCVPGTWDAMMERLYYPVRYRTTDELNKILLIYEELPLGIAPDSVDEYFPDGIILDIRDAYATVMDEGLSDTFTAEEIKRAKNLMPQEICFYMEHPEAVQEWEKEQEELLRMAEEDVLVHPENYPLLEPIPEEELLEREDEYKHDPFAKTEKKDWIRYFSDKRRFVRSCKAVRTGFCDRTLHGDLEQDLQNVIRLYLSRHGISGWLDDEKFFTIYTYLNKAVKASKKMLGGAENG